MKPNFLTEEEYKELFPEPNKLNQKIRELLNTHQSIADAILSYEKEDEVKAGSVVLIGALLEQDESIKAIYNVARVFRRHFTDEKSILQILSFIPTDEIRTNIINNCLPSLEIGIEYPNGTLPKEKNKFNKEKLLSKAKSIHELMRDQKYTYLHAYRVEIQKNNPSFYKFGTTLFAVCSSAIQQIYYAFDPDGNPRAQKK